MQNQVLECIEPHGRPGRRTLEVDTGEEIAIYSLPVVPGWPRGLRRTTVRRADDLPPLGSQLILWLRIDPQGGIAVVEIMRNVVVEILRGQARSKVITGMRLPSGCLLDVTLADQSRVNFSLSLCLPSERGATVGVAGSGTRKSKVRYSADNVFWLITDSKGIIVTAVVKASNWVMDKLRALGIDSRVIAFAAGILITAAVGAYAAYRQHRNAQASEERAVKAEDSLALAEAAQSAALATELACLDQRKDLVAQLGQISEEQSLAAEMALSFSLANTVAVEVGGTRMANEDLRAIDDQYRPNMVAAVVARIGQASGNPGPCIKQNLALGTDLPLLLLTWHPDPTLTCPLDYVSEANGVQHVGRWGLSDRMVTFFGVSGNENTGGGGEALEELLGDPRYEDRWSAFTLVLAYRDILDTVLATDRVERPPTMPSQALMWPLALLDAYNRMPSPSNGALDVEPGECVDRLLQALIADAPPAVPGEPLLPDLTQVAHEDIVLPAVPTPGCPWPQNALRDGADAALRAAARLASSGLVMEE